MRTTALKAVGYLAVSFYPELRLPYDPSWWDAPETEAQIAEIAAAAREHLLRTSRRVERVGHQRFSIGEFGVASDPSRPYHYDAAQPAERPAAKRKYCLGLLRAFGEHEPLLRGPIAFWSAGAYDVLGLLG